MMRKLFKRVVHPFLKIGLEYYYSKPRRFSYDGVSVLVHPDVFPPYFTFSTKILLNFLKEIDLKGKTFLELGCGSGIISLYAAKNGAQVTATDINNTALEHLKKAAKTNALRLEILNSDLFEQLNHRQFEYIIINPPYYPRNPDNLKEHAWFCGSNFEYFERLFKELPPYLHSENKTYMILSQDCDFLKINSIALKNKVVLTVLKKEKSWIESNYIYIAENLN